MVLSYLKHHVSLAVVNSITDEQSAVIIITGDYR